MKSFLKTFRRFVSLKMSARFPVEKKRVDSFYLIDIPRGNECLWGGDPEDAPVFSAEDCDKITRAAYYYGCLRILDSIRRASESNASDGAIASFLADAYHEVCEELDDEKRRVAKAIIHHAGQ